MTKFRDGLLPPKPKMSVAEFIQLLRERSGGSTDCGRPSVRRSMMSFTIGYARARASLRVGAR